MDINKRIEEILADLYRIEPEFKKQEPRLKRLLAELLSVRPDVTLDDEFVAGLRHQLLAAAREMESHRKAGRSLLSLSLQWTGSVAVMVVVVGLAAYFFYGSGQNKDQDAKNLLAAKMEVKAVGTQAFGNLRDVELAVATGKGGGGGEASSRDASATAPQAYGMGGGGFAPDMVSFKYTYKGEDFTVPAAQMDVYKREKGLPSGVDASSILKNLDFGILNAGNFGNLMVQSLNLAEDKDLGYSIYVSIPDGAVSIGQNWAKWPTVAKLCETEGGSEACFREHQMKLADMPDDATMISIADQFLKDHNIGTESYGEPFVNNYWKADYERAQDKSMYFIPDTVNVVYPLKMDGKETYDEGGTRIGMNVMVDARLKKAAGVSELTSQRYESSSYGTETDQSQLVAIAEKGGYHGGYYETGGRTVNVELDTPTLAYLKVWQYNSDTTNELLVPALIFPVTKTSDSSVTYRRNVVVPVIKDIINRDESQQIQPPIRILPQAVQ
ncbi:MAG: hypothetical protein ACM3NH_03010 [Candidatus Saccharibacteria bacterium]